ncbi:putative porin [Campylobacterota bacterium]
MKKIVLSMAALATVAMAEADITHPIERIEEVKDTTAVTEKSIFDRIHFKGDLRLRYESKEYEYYDGTDHGDYLGRYRLRLGAHIDITDHLQFEVGMRSGKGNPTSGNQTFVEDNKDAKPLSDYFFQSLRFNALALDYTSGNSTWKIGRSPYMMYRPIKSQLVWDNDISMNGVNYQYQDDTKIITAGINQPTYAENVTATDDVNLFLAQYVQKTKLESSTLNLGAGFYYYDGIKGNTALYDSGRLGNTVDVNKLYTNDYHIVEGFGELKFKDVLGKPFAIAAGVAYNTAADDNNFGYDLAFQLGKAKEVGDWQVKYSYTDIQEDAVLGAHSDSDNFGGGTAAKGHAIRTKYKFGKNTYLAGTYFINTRYASKDGLDGDTDYERVQLDAIITF